MANARLSPVRPELRKSLDYRGECEPGRNNNSAGMPASISSSSSTTGCKSLYAVTRECEKDLDQTRTKVNWDNRDVKGGGDLGVVVITQSIVTPDCLITSYHIYNTLLCSGLNTIRDPRNENFIFYCKTVNLVCVMYKTFKYHGLWIDGMFFAHVNYRHSHKQVNEIFALGPPCEYTTPKKRKEKRDLVEALEHIFPGTIPISLLWEEALAWGYGIPAVVFCLPVTSFSQAMHNTQWTIKNSSNLDEKSEWERERCWDSLDYTKNESMFTAEFGS